MEEPHLVKQHFLKTEELLRGIEKKVIAEWLLNHGYFPESNILPPSFVIDGFEFKEEPYCKDVGSLNRKKLVSISYPKTLLTTRRFSIQEPKYYHDIVFHLMEDWDKVLGVIFNEDLKIFSYSMPIPVQEGELEGLSDLREGRMIYEWIRMAENDLVQDASLYKVLARTDVANFYPSIYTHSISWAIEGRESSLADKEFSLTGTKIDKLFQYSNDGRTNGIPIGSALSDLIAEIVLADVDAKVSRELSDIDFVGVRFKDDYRILCQSEEDAQRVISSIADHMSEVNLTLGENKTSTHKLPEGLYREHDKEYFPYSLADEPLISFKKFEHTLLVALNVHRRHPGTSILEKFLSELLSGENELKISFSQNREKRVNEIKKFFSLLFLAKRESEKLLSQLTAIIDLVRWCYWVDWGELKPYLRGVVEYEAKKASEKGSGFEVVWYVFMSRYLKLGIGDFKEFLGANIIDTNHFVNSIVNSRDSLFVDKESYGHMFVTPKSLSVEGIRLVDRFDIFR